MVQTHPNKPHTNPSNRSDRVEALLRENNELLRQILAQQLPEQTDYSYPLRDYKIFDWASIGATVKQSDTDGASIVLYRHQQYVRRGGEGKFKEAIWFLRAIASQGSNEKTRYQRLITFKDYAAERLPRGVTHILK